MIYICRKSDQSAVIVNNDDGYIYGVRSIRRQYERLTDYVLSLLSRSVAVRDWQHALHLIVVGRFPPAN